MDCGNHGFCRKGAKDTSFIDNFDFDDRRLTQRFNQEFEHCICEPGWAGLNCDVKMDICPGRSMICLHGSTCVLSDETGDFECDCDTARLDGLRYAGKYCQYHSTTYCTIDGERPKRHSEAFCANSGKCLDFVPHDGEHPGCSCEEHFEGDHCEKLVAPTAKSSEPSGDGNESSSSAVAIVIVVMLVLIIIAVAVFLWFRRRRQSASSFFISESANDHNGKASKRKTSGRLAPFYPSLQSINEQSCADTQVFEDKLDVSDSSSVQGSASSGNDEFQDEDTPNKKETREFELPPLRSQGSSDSSLELGGLRSDTLRNTVKSDLSLQTAPSQQMDYVSNSFSVSPDQEEPLDLEEMVQKRGRGWNSHFATKAPIAGDSSHMSSDIGSMSSIESKPETMNMANFTTSHIQGQDNQSVISSEYSLSEEGLMGNGPLPTSIESGGNSSPTVKAGASVRKDQHNPTPRTQPEPEQRPAPVGSKSVSFDAQPHKDKKQKENISDTPDRKLGATRSDHYKKALGGPQESSTGKHPWRGRRKSQDSPTKDIEEQEPNNTMIGMVEGNEASARKHSSTKTGSAHPQELTNQSETRDLDEEQSVTSHGSQSKTFAKNARSKLIGRPEKKTTDVQSNPSSEKEKASKPKKPKGGKSKTSGKKGAKSPKTKSKTHESTQNQAKVELGSGKEENVHENIESKPSEVERADSDKKGKSAQVDSGKNSNSTNSGAKDKEDDAKVGMVISGEDNSIQSKLTQIGLSSSWGSKSGSAEIYDNSSASSLGVSVRKPVHPGASAHKSSGRGTLPKIDPWAEGGDNRNPYNNKKSSDMLASSGSLGVSASASTTTFEAWESEGVSKGLDVV